MLTVRPPMWYLRWKYNLLKEPEPLNNREERYRRWSRKVDAITVFFAFLIACAVVTLFHFVTYGYL